MPRSTNEFSQFDVFDGASDALYPELSMFNLAYQAVLANNEQHI